METSLTDEPAPIGAHERFRRLYAEQFRAILGYAVRRVPAREDAADVVAETFLIAWRRLDEVPRSGEARLWLYGVARRVLANHLRGEVRRSRLGDRLRTELAQPVPDPADEVVEVRTVRAAMARLDDLDREVLELAVWEELQPREIAVLLDLPGPVVRTRLTRARARLRARLGEPAPINDRTRVDDGHDPGRAGHQPGVRSVLVPKEDT